MGDQDILLVGSLWWLFIIDTVLIAAAGYVINDVFDQRTDQLNKPKNVYIGPNQLSAKSAWVYYGSLVMFGFFIALYIAYSIGKLHLLLIYPIAVGMLFLYSKSFKKLPLIGNFVVAIFCAFVPGILLYAEWDMLFMSKFSYPSGYLPFMFVFTSYIIFAFLATMVREIIKDIEDVEGDQSAGYKTLPVFASIRTSVNTSLGFGLLLLLSYGIWVLPFYLDGVYWFFAFSSIFMFLITSFILVKIYFATEKDNFSQISKWLKFLMIIALIVFLCNPFLPYSIIRDIL